VDIRAKALRDIMAASQRLDDQGAESYCLLHRDHQELAPPRYVHLP
jgi:hypothetical protein